MYKKILIAIGLVVVISLFGATGAVQAFGQGVVLQNDYGWLDKRDSGLETDTYDYLPYFDDEVELTDGGNAVGNFGEYGEYQIHLRVINQDEKDLGYARVRVEATGTNVMKIEGVWVVRVSAVDPTLPGNQQTYPVLAEVINPAGGVVDIAVPIPAGMGFLVTIAQRGDASINDSPFRTWVAVSDYAGGGLIIDSEDDCGDVYDRIAQASTMDAGYWSEPFEDYDDDPSEANQHFLNIPVGTYNIGVQDTSPDPVHEEPFVAYYDQVDVPEAAYLDVDPCEDATKVVKASVDCAAGIEGANVFMNIAEGAGFLFYDLTPGVLAAGTYDGELSFSVTPWMYWDMAIVQDDDPMNYFLVAQSFNATDREITFDLCADGVDWVQPGMDRDWNSAKLELVPPSNLDTQYFDIKPNPKYPYIPEDPFGLGGGEYKSENVVLKIDPGCCGPDGAFDAKVLLDNKDRWTPCCEEDCWPCGEFCYHGDVVFTGLNGGGGNGANYGCGCYDDIVVNGPATEQDYIDFLDCQGLTPEDFDKPTRWWYLFVPEINPWAFGEPTLFAAATGLPVDLFDPITPALPDYATIFGDGEFYMEPAGVSAMEYDVAMLDGEVMHERGDWFDAAGNQIIAVLEPAAVDPFLVFGDDPDDFNVANGGLIKVFESVADVFPEYWLGSQMGMTWTLLANDWETTPFGPVTDIGRYMYEWWLQHGYLGDIEGHESEYVDVCCFDYSDCDPCEWCEEGCKEICEIPHFWDGGSEIYAISASDVRMNGHWAWSWVMAMYELDLTTGVSEFLYAPDENVTRAEVSTFIGRIMEQEGLMPLGTAAGFPDVAGNWAEDYIMLLADYNIVKGDGGMFYPERELMRDEMAKIIEEAFSAIKTYAGTDYYWDENTTVDPTGEVFADVPASFWAVSYIEELYADGLTDGCGSVGGDLFYCPNDMVTRAQMAKFIVTALQEIEVTQGFWPVLAPEK